jgi:pentatricopeptide repeat protein
MFTPNPMRHSFLLIALLGASTARGSRPCACEPAAEIRAELRKAAAATIKDPTAFDQNVARFLALRERYPDDLFVHERYQDAVVRHGVEGHLKALAEEYQALDVKHPGDSMYHYLYLRSLLGRATASAVAGLNEMIAREPDFAPAHRTLAEIYGVETFRDLEKQRSEREKFLALCPTSEIARRPDPPPDWSPLIDQAERLLAQNGAADRIIAMVAQGLTDDEWRNQRVRPFDWYTIDFKRKSLNELRDRYWKAWSIEVACYRKAGRPEKADELLELMERRAATLQKSPVPTYWNALLTLARLYADGKRLDQAAKKITQLQQTLAESPDPQRSAELEIIRKLVTVDDK